MFTFEALNFFTSMVWMSAGRVGRSAFSSRSTSSYLRSGSVPALNSMLSTARPSLISDLSVFTSSSALSLASIGSTISFSRSVGTAPG